MARLLLVVLATLWANLANPVFVRVDTRQLPEQAAMTLAQDSSGFVWVATQGGLARFDGYRFRNFLPDPSDPDALPDGYVRALLPDGPNLWVGTSTDGLAHFDARTGKFHTWRPDPSGRRGPRSGDVDTLMRTPDGAIWIGGDGGLDRFVPSTGRFVPVAWPGEPPVVWCLLADHTGAIWAGTQDGLYVWRPDAPAFRRFAISETVYSVYEDPEGRLWAGTVSKVWELDANRRPLRVFSSTPDDAATLAVGQQWALIEPQPGVIWSGTDNGFSIIDIPTGKVRRVLVDANDPTGLPSGRVVRFLRDRSGLVWIANHVGGVLIYNPRSHGLYKLSNTRPEIGPNPNGGVLSLAVARDGALWLGGLDGRLADLNPHAVRANILTLPNRAAAQALLFERDDSLWIGTTEGMCRLTRPAKFQCPAGPAATRSDNVYTLLDDGSRLWIGGSNGLFIIRRDGSFTHIGHGTGPHALPNDQVRSLHLDEHKRMWIGTENGLDLRDPNGTITHFNFDPENANSIGTGGITTIAQDRYGRIWAGANGGPLNVISERNGRFTTVRHLGVADGMPHENVDALADDGRGTMWAATDKGVAAIDERTLRVRALGLADGVSEAGYWAGAVARAGDGTIFFGGLDGATIVEPGAESRWVYQPPVVVTSLDIGRKGIPIGSTLDGAVALPPQARDLAVEFAALDYSAPQTLRYAYRLRGYDRDWVETDATARTATYTHVPPGRYTLEVRATNRLGVWTTQPLQLALTVVPNWYETWWFRGLVILIVIFVAYVVYRVRTQVLFQRQRELEAVVESRTRELSEANAKLHELSVNDPLTGLRNRRFVSDHLDSEAAITLRRYDAAIESGVVPPSDADILFFLIDLDNFKSVNDRYGHLAGDALLVSVCEVLEETFRGSDFVARWGGDEFLAIARGSRRADAGDIAERLRATVAATAFALGGGRTINETISIGFSAFPFISNRPRAFTWSQVLAFADQALYLAKNGGRDTWCGIGATDKTQIALVTGGLDAPVEEMAREGLLEVFGPRYDFGASRRNIAP